MAQTGIDIEHDIDYLIGAMVDSSSFESASSGKQTKHRETVVNVQ